VAYHKISCLLKSAVPVLLDESVVRSQRGSVRDTVKVMRAAKKRASEATGFIPQSDMSGISRVVVVAGCEKPSVEGDELIVGPDINSASLLGLFGRRAFKGLDEQAMKKWVAIFQKERNAGRMHVMAGSEPADKFVKAYVLFHTKPQKLRAASAEMYSFLEGLYGKRIDQMWDMVRG